MSLDPVGCPSELRKSRKLEELGSPAARGPWLCWGWPCAGARLSLATMSAKVGLEGVCVTGGVAGADELLGAPAGSRGRELSSVDSFVGPGEKAKKCNQITAKEWKM
eukprot:1158981-Pelagomonas_calceolata.AAC.2